MTDDPRETTTLTDPSGNELRVIVEHHGPYRKLFVEHFKKLTGEVTRSNSLCWQATDERYSGLPQKKVNDALAGGWVRKET